MFFSRFPCEVAGLCSTFSYMLSTLGARPGQTPCSINPDLWFGYGDDDAADGAAKARVYEQAAVEARLICLRRCPLAQQRRCAALVVARGEEYGVWAGVKLPGGQYRKREELAQAHAVLRRIAAGEVTPRELPENQALLARHEGEQSAAVTVFHLPGGGVGPQTAA